jgi:hypothetical protein
MRCCSRTRLGLVRCRVSIAAIALWYLPYDDVAGLVATVGHRIRWALVTMATNGAPALELDDVFLTLARFACASAFILIASPLLRIQYGLLLCVPGATVLVFWATQTNVVPRSSIEFRCLLVASGRPSIPRTEVDRSNGRRPRHWAS